MTRWLLAAVVSLLLVAPVRAEEAVSFSLESLTRDRLESGELLAQGPVLLDFWATWCRPCVAAIPQIEALHQKWSERGVTVIGVSIDGPRNYAKVRPFVKRHRMTYPVVLDRDGSLQRRFQVTSVPTAVLLHPDGSVEAVHAGYRPGEEKKLEEAIARLVPEPESSDTP